METLKSTLKPFSILLAAGVSITIGQRAMSTYRSRPLQFSPNYTPVAVFVGGTSGIGQAMAEVLSHHTNGDSSIIILGRNRAAAEASLAQLPKPTNPKIKREFIQCDVTRMKNVHAATQEILSKYPKINFLVLSTGFMSMKGRDETEEGLDTKLAAHYYSRWKFIDGLLPALRKANEDGEDGKVLSVFSAGMSGVIDIEDLGLKKRYSLSRAAEQAIIYNDLMVGVRPSPLSLSLIILTTCL